MTSLTVAGRLLAADDRVLRGRLVPFGKPGRTNMGRVTIEPGDVVVPADVSGLFASLDHLDGRDSVAAYARIEERADGLYAEWDVPETHGGDRLLAEFRAGKRTGVSVELEPVVIRNGRASGVLVGNAFPERPAFDDARLLAAEAPDAGDPADLEAPVLEDVARTMVEALGLEWADLDDATREAMLTAAGAIAAGAQLPTDAPPADPAAGALTAAQATTTPDAAGAEDNPAEATSASSTPERTNPVTTTATAPGGLLASAVDPAAPAPEAPAPTAPVQPSDRLLASDASLADVCRLLAGASTASGGGRERLLAALSDIVPTDLTARDQPAWIGEAWSNKTYVRRIVPLLNTSEPLTGLKVEGWRWGTKPKMARYAGGKTNVPSNTVTTSAYTNDAQRFAGGHDIDRKYVDFGDAAFFEAYFAAMSESYALETDVYALERMKDTAPVLTMGAGVSGVPNGWVAIADAMLDMIDLATPTFALVEKTVYREMFLTPTDKFFEFLNASIGLEEGTLNSGTFRIVPVASAAVGTAASLTGLDRGEVLVGAGQGIKFRELGGGTPIRVEAQDLVRGGVDEACFGYAAVDTGSSTATANDSPALRLVDTVADV